MEKTGSGNWPVPVWERGRVGKSRRGRVEENKRERKTDRKRQKMCPAWLQCHCTLILLMHTHVRLTRVSTNYLSLRVLWGNNHLLQWNCQDVAACTLQYEQVTLYEHTLYKSQICQLLFSCKNIYTLRTFRRKDTLVWMHPPAFIAFGIKNFRDLSDKI